MVSYAAMDSQRDTQKSESINKAIQVYGYWDFTKQIYVASIPEAPPHLPIMNYLFKGLPLSWLLTL